MGVKHLTSLGSSFHIDFLNFKNNFSWTLKFINVYRKIFNVWKVVEILIVKDVKYLKGLILTKGSKICD
jgi:hypothetical protein